MCLAYLHVGGLVAMGFDSTNRYLLTISHNGRGVFDSVTWNRISRDDAKAYPVRGVAIGIGPIDGQRIPVVEIDYQSGILEISNVKLNVKLSYEAGMVSVNSTGT
jgi:hypothetical protein